MRRNWSSGARYTCPDWNRWREECSWNQGNVYLSRELPNACECWCYKNLSGWWNVERNTTKMCWYVKIYSSTEGFKFNWYKHLIIVLIRTNFSHERWWNLSSVNNCERCDNQYVKAKILNPRQGSSPWPPEHCAGALPTKSRRPREDTFAFLWIGYCGEQGHIQGSCLTTAVRTVQRSVLARAICDLIHLPLLCMLSWASTSKESKLHFKAKDHLCWKPSKLFFSHILSRSNGAKFCVVWSVFSITWINLIAAVTEYSKCMRSHIALDIRPQIWHAPCIL